jgi:hypothetical protein
MLAEWITALWLRIKALFRRRRLDRDLDDELQFHLAMREQKLAEDGVPAEEAHYTARRQFGNETTAKEMNREMWTFRLLETVGQVVRYGLRQLRCSPGFTAVVIVTLSHFSQHHSARRLCALRACGLVFGPSDVGLLGHVEFLLFRPAVCVRSRTPARRIPARSRAFAASSTNIPPNACNGKAPSVQLGKPWGHKWCSGKIGCTGRPDALSGSVACGVSREEIDVASYLLSVDGGACSSRHARLPGFV